MKMKKEEMEKSKTELGGSHELDTIKIFSIDFTLHNFYAFRLVKIFEQPIRMHEKLRSIKYMLKICIGSGPGLVVMF